MVEIKTGKEIYEKIRDEVIKHGRWEYSLALELSERQWVSLADLKKELNESIASTKYAMTLIDKKETPSTWRVLENELVVKENVLSLLDNGFSEEKPLSCFPTGKP